MYAIRDHEGRFVGRSRTMAGAHRSTRTRNRAGATVERSALGVGMTVFGPHLKIHHYRGSVRVTDMTNAGKRGKKVRELSVVARSQDDDVAEAMFTRVIDAILHMDYDGARAYLAGLEQAEHAFALHEVSLRGVDVEPPATTINLEKKFPDGEIVSVKASPHEFLVKDSTVISAPGKTAHGYRQDTLYWHANKKDAVKFYDWLKKNLAAVGSMTMRELEQAWQSIGVHYDQH